MKVLIAEDDPISCRMLEWLARKWGYESIAVNDGVLAAWILERDDAPKLAILDWMMPGLDGLQICRRLRKNSDKPYVYILLVTAKNQKEDVLEGLEAGADDYVTKPFDPDVLALRLKVGRRIVELQERLLAGRECGPQAHSSHGARTGGPGANRAPATPAR